MSGCSPWTFLLGALIPVSSSWSLPPPSFVRPVLPVARSLSSRLHGGVGVAESYSWTEEQFEIEVTLAVPAGTSAKDVEFKCASESLDLRLRGGADGGARVLLDGARRTRGKICVDGTFWSLEGAGPDRAVTVALEKHFVPASREGGLQTFDALTDFDWGGLYPDDEAEVSHRKYDVAEDLDVREYAAKLGVDIDNIDMSKVNRTMFGAGLDEEGAAGAGEEEGAGSHFNITQATLEQLTRVGLAKEVVRQGDGTEYEMGADGRLNDERTFSMLGKDVSDDELREAGIAGGRPGGGVPAMFTEQSVPVEEAPGYRSSFDAGPAAGAGIIEDEIVETELTAEHDGAEDMADIPDAADEAGTVGTAKAAPAATGDAPRAAAPTDGSTEAEASANRGATVAAGAAAPADPIDMLTVVKLKQILKAQGLKVGGTKQILRERLRAHVSTLLQEE